MRFFDRKTARTGVIILALSLALLGGMDSARAEDEDKLAFSAYADVLSQYLFRGVALSRDGAVIQPSMTATYKGFSVNVWGNVDTNDETRNQDLNWNETDLTVSYSRELMAGLTGNIGVVYYGLEGNDTFEIYAGLGYAFPWFSTALTVYRDVWNFEGTWVQFDVSKNIPLNCYDMSIDLTATAGYQNFNSGAVAEPIRVRFGDDYWAG